MRMAYVVYPDFTGLDVVGPYEVISRWPEADVHFVASSREPVRADRGLTVIPTDTPDTMPQPDLIVVPGSQNPVPVPHHRPRLPAALDELVQQLARLASACSMGSGTIRAIGTFYPNVPRG